MHKRWPKTHAAYSISCGNCEKEYLGQSKCIRNNNKKVFQLKEGGNQLWQNVCVAKHAIARDGFKIITTNKDAA